MAKQIKRNRVYQVRHPMTGVIQDKVRTIRPVEVENAPGYWLVAFLPADYMTGWKREQVLKGKDRILMHENTLEEIK